MDKKLTFVFCARGLELAIPSANPSVHIVDQTLPGNANTPIIEQNQRKQSFHRWRAATQLLHKTQSRPVEKERESGGEGMGRGGAL